MYKYQLEIISYSKINNTNEFEIVKYRRKAFVDLQTSKMNLVRKLFSILTIKFDQKNQKN